MGREPREKEVERLSELAITCMKDFRFSFLLIAGLRIISGSMRMILETRIELPTSTPGRFFIVLRKELQVCFFRRRQTPSTYIEYSGILTIKLLFRN